MKNEIRDWYIKNRPTYKRLSSKVESLLSEVFESNNISYHIITSRTKSVDSVTGKISKNKYDNPTEQIQDFSGIRIITYVEDEIKQICDLIEGLFQIDESNSSNKSDALGIDKVGYKSVHYIASLDKKRLALPEYKQYDGKCFEIQVRTILQHAWAEIEHDRNYKFAGTLPPDIGRRFKILAGVLEMADREFNNISNEIDEISQSAFENTQKGNLKIPLSSTTFKQFLLTRFKSLIDLGFQFMPDSEGDSISDLEKFGISTLEELNTIIPENIDIALQKLSSKDIHISALVIRILIINDSAKYFTEVAHTEDGEWVWTGEDEDGTERKFFSTFGIEWKPIENEYGVIFSVQ
jgi:ppGpp synthetase/RelA/SpoT-type nucleotidyltranferase